MNARENSALSLLGSASPLVILLQSIRRGVREKKTKNRGERRKAREYSERVDGLDRPEDGQSGFDRRAARDGREAHSAGPPHRVLEEGHGVVDPAGPLAGGDRRAERGRCRGRTITTINKEETAMLVRGFFRKLR